MFSTKELERISDWYDIVAWNSLSKDGSDDVIRNKLNYMIFQRKHPVKPTIDEIGYLDDIRQRLGLDKNDTSRDEEIEAMSTIERVRLLIGYRTGHESYYESFKSYFESQGLYLTTDPEAEGVIHD